MPKRELTRIVRKPDGQVTIDPTGKMAGRGAYLCSNKRCWLAALRKKSIERALKAPLTDEEHARIEEYASQLPDIDIDES